LIGKMIVERLEAVAAVTNLVSSRIYPVILPQTPTYPAIVYEVVTTVRGQSHGGPHNLVQPRVQIDIFAETYEAAWDIEAAVRGALDGFSGALSGKKVWNVFHEDSNDLYAQDIKKSRVISDYTVAYRD